MRVAHLTKAGFMSTRLVLIDDDQNILISVSLALEAEGYVVDRFFDSEKALLSLIENPPDLAIVDIKMPRMTGTELVGKLRINSTLPIIFLTSKDDELDEVLGFGMGADDYITKPFSQRLLLARIKAVLCRADYAKKPHNPLNSMRYGNLSLDSDRHLCIWHKDNIKLTVTEFLILHALTMHPGHVLSRDQLMDAAYGESMFLSDRTIDSHIKRIRTKFRRHDPCFDQIETLYGIGYKYKGET